MAGFFNTIRAKNDGSGTFNLVFSNEFSIVANSASELAIQLLIRLCRLAKVNSQKRINLFYLSIYQKEIELKEKKH